VCIAWCKKKQKKKKKKTKKKKSKIKKQKIKNFLSPQKKQSRK